MKVWARIKLGAIPFVVVAIILFLVYHLSGFVLHWGFHFTGNSSLDVLVNIAVVIVSTCYFGYLFERNGFQSFARDYFPRIPLLGPILLLLILPRKLDLIEIKTVPGLCVEDGSFEYALITRDPWEENGIKWYRAHTLGLTGRLYARISESNVRPTNRTDREIWLTVISMGLL